MTQLQDPPLSARRTQTRERLMAAATTVFAERGVIGASVEEVCEAAGFSRGAFYSNFADKDALVLAMIHADAAAQQQTAEQAIADAAVRPGRPVEELVNGTLARLYADDGASDHAVLARQELLLHAARTPALHAAYAEFVNSCAEQIAVLIGDALVQAGLEFVLPRPAAVELLVAAYERVRLRSLFGGDLDTTLLHDLLLVITRPVGGAPEDSVTPAL